MAMLLILRSQRSIGEEIETMWNEPNASLKFENLKFEVSV